jgi:hypothetical protein
MSAPRSQSISAMSVCSNLELVSVSADLLFQNHPFEDLDGCRQNFERYYYRKELVMSA